MTILKELSEAIGVSGDEGAVRDLVVDAIQGHVDSYHVDAMGSVIARQNGTGNDDLTVMIAAHMDEIGFMVTGYDGDGLIHFSNIGGVDDRILPGLRVTIGPERVPGVIIWTPIHMNREQKVTKLSNLRIDIGVSSKDTAKSKVGLGDRVAFESRFIELDTTTVRGKAFDDRAGVAALIDVLQNGPYLVNVAAAFTVQEEVGLRGAQVAAQAIQPDVALVLEGTTAHDVPNPSAEPDDTEVPNPACKMGEGPVLTVMDRSMIVHPSLLNFLRTTAESDGIPYQLKTQLGGGTDGGRIHIAGEGRPSAVIAMPCRYIHSPAALMNTEDYNNAVKLVQAALNGITHEAFANQ